mmetsp:Transcript_15705/g.26056  ORF Transcript_15705/g.26056 Transcript_15705/m.26056 type:complete len:297 (-) Transcript_15705:536-1426(-)
MGVCRCRAVSSQYCFVHRTHVCDNCIAKNHEICVVRSYLEWVQDSDYEWPPKCSLCNDILVEGNGPDGHKLTIRLMCRDVFHVACLNKYASSFPANTTAAGYICPRNPKCMIPIFPPAEAKSALAASIRDYLSTVKWGPMLASSSSPALPESKDSIQDAAAGVGAPGNTNSLPLTNGAEPVRWSPAAATTTTGAGAPVVTNNINPIQQSTPALRTSTSIPSSSSLGVASRKQHVGRDTVIPMAEEEEDKYRKRGILRSVIGRSGVNQRTAMVFFVIALCLLLVVFMVKQRNRVDVE